MGVLKRNMRDDAGHPRDDASFTDNGRQMDNFEDERGQARWHRRSAVARGVAKRGLVAFLAFAMAFGTTPAQMWADGAEGVAEALSQAVSTADTGSNDATDSSSTEQNGAAGAVSESGAASDSADASTAAADGAVSAGDNSAASVDAQSSASTVDQTGSTTAATAAPSENLTKAADAAKKQVEVSFSIVGADADGKAQTWVAPTQLKLDEGATAADAFVKLVSLTGISTDYDPATSYGFYLKSITSPYDGRTLAYDEGSHAYWRLFVDGQPSLGASSVKLTQGQKIEFAYTGEATAPTVKDQVAANVTVIGRDAQGNRQTWIDNGRYEVASNSSALYLSKVAFEAGNIDTVAAGSSIVSLTHDGVTLGSLSDYTNFWQLYVNGKLSNVYADQVTIKSGDSITWFYGGWGESPVEQVKASFEVIGPDANGNNSIWYSSGIISLDKGSCASDLTAQGLASSGLIYDLKTVDKDGYFYLSTITRDGKTYGWDQESNRYWQPYVNGELSDLGADKVVLKDGDKVQYVYASDDEKPFDSVIVNPSATRPDWPSSWNGFGNSGSTTLVNVPTPTESAELLWKVSLKTASDPWVALGDPVIAGGYIFITTNTDLIKIDSTGKVLARVAKGGQTQYFSRPVYADGLIVCANDDGSLCAFSADSLECVWKTPSLGTPSSSGKYQSNSTMTISNGCVYAEFVAGVSYSGTASEGLMVCVDLATGQIKWKNSTVKSGDSTGEGYYWAGACASGSDLVIADESGYVKLIDGDTGKVKASASIDGLPSRSTVVSAGTIDGMETFLVVGRQPATLFKVVRNGDSLSVVGKCQFANTSTSTPAVANGKVYIGGNNASYAGQFTVIDLDTMTVDKTVLMGSYAEVKASPLVSVQGDDTYVYFTSNQNPGSVYRYAQSTGEVLALYTPSGADANYCTASVISDDQGNLYYTNDSGVLFALKASAGYRVTFDSAGGSAVPSAMPAKDKPMAQIADPVREGYTFLGWYTSYGAKWDFSQPVSGDMTLTAKWQKNADKSDQGSGSTGDNGTGSSAGSGSGIAGSPSGSGTAGKQAAGSIAAKFAPVASTTKITKSDDAKKKDSKSSDDDSKKKSKSDSSKSSSDDKKSGKSSTRTVKTATVSASDAVRETTLNPFAIAGIAVGVIGLILIAVFVFTRRDKDGSNAR